MGGPLVEVVRSWADMAPYLSFLAEQNWFPEADPSCLEYESGLTFLVCRMRGQVRSVLGARREEAELSWRLGTKVVGHSRVRQVNVEFGRVWGDPDEQEARALVAGVRGLVDEGLGEVARFGYLTEGSALELAVRRSSLLFRDHFPMRNKRWLRPMPESYEALLQEHSKNTRRKVKSIQNRLRRSFTEEYRCWTRIEDLDRALADVRHVDQASYQSRIGAGFDPDEVTMRKLRRLCADGVLRIYILYLNGRPVAFYLGHLYRGTYWGEYTGFDDAFKEYRPGTAVFHFVMQDLCAVGGVKMMDFGLGDSGYKEVYARAWTRQVEMTLFRHSWRGLGLLVAKDLTGSVRTIAYALLEKTGLLKTLKSKWRRKAMAGEADSEEHAPAATS